MANGNASIDLRGVLAIKPAAVNGCGSSGTTGPIFQLSLSPGSRAPAATSSMQPHTIESPAAFEALPVAANLRGQVLYISALDLAPWLVRVTFETTPAATVPLAGQGMILLNAPPDDRIVLVELQGQGRIEWTVTGGIV